MTGPDADAAVTAVGNPFYAEHAAGIRLTEMWVSRYGTGVAPPGVAEPEEPNMPVRCEDYPCCGHTPDDPCGPQDYDRPGFYDTSIPGQEHRLCDHETGDCEVA